MSDEKSHIRRVINKSIGVTETWIKYISYAVIGLATIAVLGYGLIWIYEVAYPVIFNPALINIIPWYYYPFLGVILTILVYSELWLISQELTNDDWQSVAADLSAVLIIAPVTIALLLILSFAIISAVITITIIAIIIASIAIFILFALIALTIDPIEHTTCWYYIFRFPGAAWHHYQNRK